MINLYNGSHLLRCVELIMSIIVSQVDCEIIFNNCKLKFEFTSNTDNVKLYIPTKDSYIEDSLLVLNKDEENIREIDRFCTRMSELCYDSLVD